MFLIYESLLYNIYFPSFSGVYVHVDRAAPKENYSTSNHAAANANTLHHVLIMNVLTHSRANANVSMNHLPVLEYGSLTTLPIPASVLTRPSVPEAKFTIQKHVNVSARQIGCPSARDISGSMTLHAVVSVPACPSAPISRTSMRICASACVQIVQPPAAIASSDTGRKPVAVSVLESYQLFSALGAGIALKTTLHITLMMILRITLMMILHITLMTILRITLMTILHLTLMTILHLTAAEAATAAPSTQKILQTQVMTAERAIQAATPSSLIPLQAVSPRVLDHLTPPQARTAAPSVLDRPVTLHPPGEGFLHDSFKSVHADNG